MKFNHIHEKTAFLPIENQLVQVSSFPNEIKNEVETYDRLAQQRLDTIFELEKIEMAMMLKHQQIVAYANQKLKETAEANAPQPPDSSSNPDEKPKKATTKK